MDEQAVEQAKARLMKLKRGTKLIEAILKTCEVAIERGDPYDVVEPIQKACLDVLKSIQFEIVQSVNRSQDFINKKIDNL